MTPLLLLALAPGVVHLAGDGWLIPFVAAPSDAVAVSDEGEIRYDWPPVNSMYLLAVPLAEIDLWMAREAWRAVKIHKWGRHDLLGDCPQRDRGCMCANGRLGPYPIGGLLTTEQWGIYFGRVAREARASNDLTHARAVLRVLVEYRRPDESSKLPDLTPIVLLAIDAAARGCDDLRAPMARVGRWSQLAPDLYDHAAVLAAFEAAMQATTDLDAALMLAKTASSLGIRDELPTDAMLERFTTTN